MAIGPNAPALQPASGPAPLRVLALGAGVQSTTVLLLAVHRFLPIPLDCAIFADTGWEPRAVYEHLAWLEEVACAAGISVHRVSAGNLPQDVLDAVAGVRRRVANPPLFVRSLTGKREGMLRRSCTHDYKIVPIRRKVRQLAETRFGTRRLPASCVEQWFGISLDEYQRMRTSDVTYIAHRYPLIDVRMTRGDCVRWLRDHGYRIPRKSACLGCPFRSDEAWREVKAGDPSEWEDTVAFDRAIRRGVPGVQGEAFLHRSLIPLDRVDFAARPSLFDQECSGHCGV